jgi:hypothetical protein
MRKELQRPTGIIENAPTKLLTAALAVSQHMEWRTFCQLVNEFASEEKANLFSSAFDSSPIAHGKLVGKLAGLELAMRLPEIAREELDRREKRLAAASLDKPTK